MSNFQSRGHSSHARPLLRLLAIGFAALPFLFGLARAIQTRRDLRSLILALASGAAAALALRLWRQGQNESRASRVLVRGAIAFTAATVVGGVVAGMMTRMTSPGAWAVAIAFGICFGMSAALASLG